MNGGGLMEEAAGLDGFQGYKGSTRVLATLVFVKCGTPRSALRQSVVSVISWSEVAQPSAFF